MSDSIAAGGVRDQGDAPRHRSKRRGLFGWVLFDWAAQPYFTLIITFIYGPYFAARLAPDPATGQAYWGFATSAAGLVIALLSPVLGAIADASGRRKPWIAAFGVLIVIGSTTLWWGVPGAPNAIAIALIGFVIASIGVEFATVFNNAMMPNLVPRDQIGRLSGIGWATGYVGGVVCLVLTLGFLAGDQRTGKTFFGLTPWFGLDPKTFAGDRITGPLTAIWFVVFVIPLFLFTPDNAARQPIRQAVGSGLRTLRETLRTLPRHRDAMLFLIANMIYSDGLIALFAFGGIYAAGTFGWGTIQIGVFGILLAISGAIGALVGGWLDDRFGPKRVALSSIVLLLASILAILSISPDRIAFVIPVAPPVPGRGLYGSAPEQMYLVLGFVIGIAAGPLQSATRSMLVRLAPREKAAQFFGLLALSGKVTSFFGPLAVGVVTAATMNQKAGMAVLLVFFGVGAAVLSFVQLRR